MKHEQLSSGHDLSVKEVTTNEKSRISGKGRTYIRKGTFSRVSWNARRDRCEAGLLIE